MRDIINFDYGIRYGTNTPNSAKGEKYPYRSFFDIMDVLSFNDLDFTIDFMSNDNDYKKGLELDFAIKREVYMNGVNYVIPGDEETKKQKELLTEYKTLTDSIASKHNIESISEDVADKISTSDLKGYEYQSFFGLLDLLAKYDASWVLNFINEHGDIYNKAINLDFTIKRVCFGLGNQALDYKNFYVSGLLEEYNGLITNLIRGYMMDARYQRTKGIPEEITNILNRYGFKEEIPAGPKR